MTQEEQKKKVEEILGSPLPDLDPIYIEGAKVSVSYTHLDVYKRQGLRHGDYRHGTGSFPHNSLRTS